jgi:hypothetical protein
MGGGGIMYANNLEKDRRKRERHEHEGNTEEENITDASSLNEISSAVGEGGETLLSLLPPLPPEGLWTNI